MSKKKKIENSENKFLVKSKELLARKENGEVISLEEIKNLACLATDYVSAYEEQEDDWKYGDDYKPYNAGKITLFIPRCVFCGGYDYDEKPIPISYDSDFGKLIKDDKRIEVIDCCDCNGCGDW